MKLFLFVVIFFSLGSLAFANNLSVSNVSLVSPDATNNTIHVQFDISWENSWRNDENYDAVWVFIKYSTDSGTTWYHATLQTEGTDPSGTTEGSGTALSVIVPSDKIGAFLQRSSTGAGTVSNTDVELVWDYGAASIADSVSARVQVFALEMVYIPTGAFYVGDGDGSTESTNALHSTDNTALVFSSASSGSSLTVDSNGNDDIDTSPLTMATFASVPYVINFVYPTGYAEFYLMKYEITEGQWVGFFNTLTAAQKTNRDITAASGKNSDSFVERNSISWSSGNATTTRADRACGYLSWMDLCAYLDWAGLCPMTELEFEKAARGPSDPISGEYVTGTTTSPDKVATITLVGSSTTEDGTEIPGSSTDNSNYDQTSISGGGETASKGPVRSGIFANGSTGRIAAGAGYYGNMELMGNTYERVVTIGNSAGRQITTLDNGDGVLTTTTSYEGNATNTSWPGIDGTVARGVTGAVGSGSKGGGYDVIGATTLRTSERSVASTTSSARTNHFGGRGVRHLY